MSVRSIAARARSSRAAQHLTLSASDLLLFDDHQIFDPGLPQRPAWHRTRLIGQDHARFEPGGPELRNPLRPFVHRQIRADAMSRAMVEIEARAPQGGPR